MSPLVLIGGAGVTEEQIKQIEENIKHAYETGLERKRCGEEHHAHKLTEDEVKYIRQVYIKRDKEFGAVALSKRFGVDRTTIHDVVKGKMNTHG